MAIEAHEFLTYANLTRSGATKEVVLRRSASCAYYGALHRVNDTFEEPMPVNPIVGRKESSHGKIINKALWHFKQRRPGYRNAAEIAKILSELRELRNEADYSLDREFNASHADTLIRRSAEVSRLCISVASAWSGAAAQAHPETSAGPDEPPAVPPSKSSSGRPSLKIVD